MMTLNTRTVTLFLAFIPSLEKNGTIKLINFRDFFYNSPLSFYNFLNICRKCHLIQVQSYRNSIQNFIKIELKNLLYFEYLKVEHPQRLASITM